MTGVEAALASGLLKVAANKLVLLIASEFASIMGVTKDLSELQDILAEITSWLFTVHDRAIESDPSCRWVIKLKFVAYDIDDLLNEVYIEAEKYKIGRNDVKYSRTDCFCAKPKLFLFRYKMANKIKAIKERFSEIVKQRKDVSTIVNNLPSYQHLQSTKRTHGELSLLGNVEQSKIPIRNLEKDGIISKLIESNGENAWIVSIIGLGGSGKTTLAKLICHDEKIKKHFKDTIFWVHVSQEFSVEKLIGKLFEAIFEQKSDLQAQQYMVRAISSKLSGKQFLLILDDAWHDDLLDWGQFMVHVNCGTLGSKILITTRDQKVAEAAKSRHIFNLEFLSEVESWTCFSRILGWWRNIWTLSLYKLEKRL